MIHVIYGFSEHKKKRLLGLLPKPHFYNPENNLHPSFQIKFAESLTTGTVSTNSDLIVRRLLRASMESKLKLTITFVGDEAVVKLKVKNGRIKNWPKGFMDDDVAESRALIDALYRNP